MAYPSWELFNTSRGKSEASQENLKDNKVKGRLSYKSASRLANMVHNWANCVTAYCELENRSIDDFLTFVTLTLSAKQSHNDLEIKRELLNPFLIYAKRKWGVKTFIWKAEPQKNENIHFHLIFDRKVHWREIRDTWNGLQDRIGYLTEFEKKHGHRDPNSTDIHSLYKDKKGNTLFSVAAYMAKYISKNEESDRPLLGRVWGCSDNLKLLQNFTDYSDNELSEIWNFFKSIGFKEIKKEYFGMICGSYQKNLKTFFPVFWQKLQEFYRKQFFEIVQG